MIIALGRVFKPAQGHLSPPFRPLLRPFDVPPVRLLKSSLHGMKIRHYLLSSEYENTP